MPGNQRVLATHPQLSVTGCELPPLRLMAKSQEGCHNVVIKTITIHVIEVVISITTIITYLHNYI
jgi:hypothetical protein